MTLELKNIEFNLREKGEFFSSLASLYESGMPIGDTFRSMSNSTRNEKIKAVTSFISKQIDKGKTLQDAINPCKTAIGLAYTKLISAGEESGKLENILSNICSNITKQQEIQSNLITALIYPVCMFIFAFTIALIFQFFVLPSLHSVTEYTTINPVSLAISAVIKIVLIYIILAGIFIFIIKTPKLRKTVKKLFMSLWFIKGLLINYYFTNFFYIMSLSYEAGIPSASSVMLASSVIGIEEIQKKIEKAGKMIENGTPVSRALNITGVFSGFAMSQISAGEEAGRLDKNLRIAGNDYQNQMDIKIKAMLKLLGPLVIIFVGIMVGIIAIKGYSEYYKAIFSIFG